MYCTLHTAYPGPWRLSACVNSCVAKNGSTSSSASPPPKQQPTDVLAPCSGNQCFERQRELIDCLTYEMTASQSLDEQLTLDERSLAGQLVAATDSKERSTAELFDLANRMDAAFCDYRESVLAAEAASRALAEQRDAVHEGQAKVENLSSRLAEAKTSVAAYVQLKHDSGDFSVYATGCGPRDVEHSTRSGGVDCVVAGATTTRPVPAASKTPLPPTPISS